MTNLKILIQFLLLSIFSNYAFAQEPIVIGEKYTIYSNVLGEERAVWIYLPSDYNNDTYAPRKYPIMYFLDGDSHFHSLSGIQQFLSKGVYASAPQMIMVGILNTDRARDLTPTHYYNEGKGPKHSFKTSGGGPNFMAFLEKELMPVIEKKYRTNDYKLFVGHSFGGLTVLNTFLTRKDLFDAYIAIDPSIWWHDDYVLNQAKQKFKTENFDGKLLYLAQANNRITELDTTTYHQRAIMAFKLELEKYPNNGLKWAYRYFEDEDHGSVPLPAEYYGLKFIYDGYQSEIKMVAEHPEMLTLNYQEISEKLNYQIKPPESLVDWLGDYCLKTDRPKNAEVFFQLNKELYPNSPHVDVKLAELKSSAGN
ncbi:alpha/beta hydrolase [Chondrinema litorale]|uniref:alpha/beta hydrolase n=1 Tax=Chondrinema litorale TaxID=2994555 RepID=UPI0025429048|nr:alpha/beta hydrolase-fold protein [Chondrinema litorale]UZR98293.1 alpha/beta hydrolase-fold protein [Chondrinema litorale]